MKKQILTAAMLLGLIFAVLHVRCLPVQAANTFNVHQTGATENSITVSWDEVEDATSYSLIYAKSVEDVKQKENLVKLGTKTTYTIEGLKAPTRLIVVVSANGIRSYNNRTGEYETDQQIDEIIAGTLPGKLTGFKVYSWSKNYKKAKLVCLKNPYKSTVNGIEWRVRNYAGKITEKGSSKDSLTIITKKLKYNQVYKLEVRALMITDEKKEVFPGPWAEYTLVPQPKIKAATVTEDGKLKVQWRKVKGATGYKLYASTKSNRGFRCVASIKKGTKTTALAEKYKGKAFERKNGNEYYFYVVAYCKQGRKTYKSLHNKKAYLSYKSKTA